MTNAELKTAVRDDLSIATGDLFYSDAYIQRIVNRAVKWYAGLHLWQQTQWGYKYTTVSDDVGDEYINYPEDFQTDSIWKLQIGTGRDSIYDRKNFEDYLRYQQEFGASATDKIFSDHRRQIFINPAPASVGLVISIWGHQIPTTMSADADTHPFAGEADPEEAIVKYAIGTALKKGRGTLYSQGVAECNAARSIADKVWETQKKEQAKYQTKDAEMFEFFEVLPPNGGERRTQRGNFESYP